jgi:diguanylate cyclase (GGDEF)-like protein/PAS domain S-box-containing protein
MNLVRQVLSRQSYRWLTLTVIGVLGLLVTGVVNQSLSTIEENRLEHRFQMTAAARAEALIGQMRQPLEHLEILQRFFASVEQVDRVSFRAFADPMLSQHGVRSYGWFPHVAGNQRAAFEERGRKAWDARFALSDLDGAGQRIRAGQRPHYFPLLYSVPENLGRLNVGYDLYAAAGRQPLIDRAIDSGAPAASTIGPLLIDPAQSDTILIVVPVFRDDVIPATPAERQASAKGVLVAILSVGRLFAAANGSLPDNGLNVRLVDRTAGAVKPLLAVWQSPLARGARPTDGAPLTHTAALDLAGHAWSLQIDATPVWREANRTRDSHLVFPFGVLATLALLLLLHSLFRRSAFADRLEVTHASDLEQWRATEMWANKLSMAVEQNPATIYITDLDGRIEYVNEKFVETTGYQREEAIGQHSSLLRPTTLDTTQYLEMWETMKAGRNWQGDLQSMRRDGTLYWERILFAPIRARDGAISNFMAIKENISELREVMTRLQDSESRFLGAMSVMVEGLAVISPDGAFVFANRAAEEFMAGPGGRLRGRRSEELDLERLREDGSVCPPDEYPSIVTLREGREIREAVVGFRCAGEPVRWMQVNTMPLRTGDDQRWGVVMTLSDITGRRRSEEQLKLAFEAIRCSGEGILVTDAEHRIISANPAFEAMTGYSMQEVTGETPAFVASGRHDERFYATMHEALHSAGHWQGEVWNRRKDGEVFPEWLGVSVVREIDGRAKYFVYIYSDMTERKETQRRIEFLAHHDPLTGLPNRLLLRDRVEHALAKASRAQSGGAMIFLDLDRFKTINDSLGHPVGDALLKAVVERLKGCVRESDTISRQGGDEFIILLDDVRDRESVSRVADKIHLRMAEPVALENHALNTSFSMGIALYPEDGSDFDTLLQKADTAMYHAKEAGRNGHRFFTEQMNRQVVEHLTLETQLRFALEKKQFVLHYQPQLDLRDGRIVGVEALVRWNHPEHGLISPGRFIPVAEDSGLIVPIGAWVLGEACRQGQAWQNAGLGPFAVAVNLSAVQFRRPDLVNTVINALVLSELDSQWLELELTESLLIQDAEMTLDSLRRLKALGVKLSVDDFGTGYSSLAYLKRFAVDKLKIDQSFVRDLASDPDDAAIVRAIIQMAHSLKLKTIAEGVESEEQARILGTFKCDEVQGYRFARPMPADELEAFVRAHQPGQ